MCCFLRTSQQGREPSSSWLADVSGHSGHSPLQGLFHIQLLLAASSCNTSQREYRRGSHQLDLGVASNFSACPLSRCLLSALKGAYLK